MADGCYAVITAAKAKRGLLQARLRFQLDHASEYRRNRERPCAIHIRWASFPSNVVCIRCDRAGSYHVDGVLARFGRDIALPDLLMELATRKAQADF
jgi:hypothetical protein